MISALVDKEDLIEALTVGVFLFCFFAKLEIFFSLVPGESAGNS